MSSDVYEVGGRAPHDTLGVPRDADRDQVIRAFRRRVRLGGHPDTGGDERTFEDLVRARDLLLDPRRQAVAELAPRRRPVPQPRVEPEAPPAPAPPPPPRTNRVAIATVVLALLGPLWWPLAIVVGHVALRRIKRTGEGGGTVIPIVLLLLYVLTVPAVLLVLTSLFTVR